MRESVNRIFKTLLTIFIVLSIIVGVAWLFDSEPSNLYTVWKISFEALMCSTLFLILFGGNK